MAKPKDTKTRKRKLWLLFLLAPILRSRDVAKMSGITIRLKVTRGHSILAVLISFIWSIYAITPKLKKRLNAKMPASEKFLVNTFLIKRSIEASKSISPMNFTLG